MHWFDALSQALATSSGIGLIGLMLVRRAPRGGVLGFKVVGFDAGPIVEPHMKNFAKPLFWVFVIAAFAAMAHSF